MGYKTSTTGQGEDPKQTDATGAFSQEDFSSDRQKPYRKPHKPKGKTITQHWNELRNTKLDRKIELFFAAAIVFFAAAQYVTSCNNNQATTKQTALLIAAAKTQACAAERFADSAESINQGISQAVDKLKDQASISRESLAVSQRALLSTGTPEIDFLAKQVNTSITNFGRVMSGQVTTTVHEATLAGTDENGLPSGKVIECHWGISRVDGLAPNDHLVQGVLVPDMDRSALTVGKQGTMYVLQINYRDGFSATPLRTISICGETRLRQAATELEIAPCNFATTLKLIKKLESFPHHRMDDPMN